MHTILDNTAFADAVHLLSNGKLVKSKLKSLDSSQVQKYFHTNEATGDVVVDWFGDEDPECPYNWPFMYKCWATFLLFIMTMSIYMGASIVSPAIPNLAQYFDVSRITATLSISLFVWGYGFGPLLMSPITEIPWIGRNGPYVSGLFLFTILQVPTALSKDVAGFMILRFLAGFFGSSVLATGGATIGDMWRLSGGFANALAFWGFGNCAGPTLGPLISGYAVQNLGWRWSIWPLLFLNGFTFLLIFFAFPETSSATILTRRANELRKLTGNSKFRSQAEIDSGRVSPKTLLYETLCRPFQMTVTELVLLCANVYLAYVYGILYCFFEAYPLTLQGRHGFSTGELGVSYVSGIIGVGFTYMIFFVYNIRVVIPRIREKRWRPEYRMEPAFVGGVLFPIAMFWFGWTSFKSIHWISPVMALGLFFSSAFLLFQSLAGYAGENFPRYLASAFASNGFFRAMVGGAFPLFATQMFDRLTIQGGCSLLGGLGVLLFPITILFYVYGPKLRAMSEMAGLESKEDLENNINAA